MFKLKQLKRESILLSLAVLLFFSVMAVMLSPLIHASGSTLKYSGSIPTTQAPYDMASLEEIAISPVNGDIFVAAQYPSSSVLIFNNNQVYLSSINVANGTPFYNLPNDNIFGLAVDGNGSVYIGMEDGNIYKFNSTFNYVSHWDANSLVQNGLTIDSNNNIYLSLGLTVAEYDANGNIIKFYGGQGKGNGQFTSTGPLAVDNQNNLYVVDSGNHDRIEEFDNSGNYVNQWTDNNYTSQSLSPSSMTINTDNTVFITWVDIYMTGSPNETVAQYTTAGSFIKNIGASGVSPGNYLDPYSISHDSNGNLYLSDQNLSQIDKFDINGNYLSEWPNANQLSLPAGLQQAANGSIYVADPYRGNSIVIFDSNGNFVKRVYLNTLNAYGSSLFLFAINSLGHIYAYDHTNNGIDEFDSSGNLLKTLGSGLGVKDTGPVTDQYDNVYALEHSGSNRYIQEYDVNGNPVRTIPTNDTSAGLLYAVNSAGDIYYLLGQSHKIEKLDKNGNVLATYGSRGNGTGQYVEPLGLAVGHDGSVYVADPASFVIDKYGQSGSYIENTGSRGSGNGEFGNSGTKELGPLDVIVGQNGLIYASDPYNGRIEIFQDLALAGASCSGNPSAPLTLTSPSQTASTIALSWVGSYPAAGCVLAGYEVYRDGNYVSTVTSGVADDFSGTIADPQSNTSVNISGSLTNPEQSNCNSVPTIAIQQVFPEFCSYKYIPTSDGTLTVSLRLNNTTSQVFMDIGDDYGDSQHPTIISNPDSADETISLSNAKANFTYIITIGDAYVTQSGFSDGGLNSNTTYGYSVDSIDSNGHKSSSVTVSAKTLAVVALSQKKTPLSHITKTAKSPPTSIAQAITLRQKTQYIQPTNALIKPSLSVISKILSYIPVPVIRAFPWLLLLVLLLLTLYLSSQSVGEYKNRREVLVLIHKLQLLIIEKDNFLKLTSHYLRTPITQLAAGLELLALDDKQGDLVDNLKPEVKTLSSVIDNVINQINSTVNNHGSALNINQPNTGHTLRQKSAVFKTLFNPLFWLPMIGVGLILPAIDYIIRNYTKISLGKINLLTQLAFYILIGSVLYGSLRYFYLNKRVTNQINDLLTRKITLSKARNEFIALTTSSINTPLSKIKTLIKNLLPDAPANRGIIGGTNELSKMLDKFNLINLLSTNSSDKNNSAHKIDIKHLINQSIEELKSQSQAKTINILLEDHLKKFQVPVVKANEQLIRQIVYSVLDNAVKFNKPNNNILIKITKGNNTPPSETLVSDRTSSISNYLKYLIDFTVGRKPVISIAITDHGDGLTSDRLSSLFEPFNQANTNVETFRQGLGFNLYLDKIITDFLGGSIVAKSVPGRGTTVNIRLPIEQSTKHLIKKIASSDHQANTTFLVKPTTA